MLLISVCQVEPLGRLGESLVDHAVKNRNFSAHEYNYDKLQERAFALIHFPSDQ